jgi:regulatory protein
MVSGKANSSSPGSDTGGKAARDAARRARGKPPLTETKLRDLALHYAARFASTASRLEAYLLRKISERGLAEDADGRTVEVDVPALVARLVELGYVDDDAYARMRARDLGARGYGGRRVEESLRHAGVGERLRRAHAPGEAAGRRAAAVMAQKKRLGPFGARAEGVDPLSQRKAHEKAVAAMLRAGHQYEHVKVILAASRVEDIEDWLAEAGDEDEGTGGSWQGT